MITQKEIPIISESLFACVKLFQFDSRRNLRLLLCFLVLAYTVGGEEGAGHIVPDGEDRTGDAAGRCEVHESQRGSQTGILHADFDGHRASLRGIQAEMARAEMAEQHAAKIVQDDDTEDEESIIQDRTSGEGDHAGDSDDDDQCGEHRHDRIYLLHLTREEIVDADTYEQRQEHHLHDGHHHGHEIDIDPGTGDEPYEERRDKWRKDGIHHRHGYRQSDVGFGDVGNDIRSRAAGAAADKDDADRDFRRKGEEMDQCEGSRRHDDELQHRADRYILRLFEYIPEITGGEAHTHAEHDDTEQRRDLRNEGLHHLRPENAEDACQHDADRHVLGTNTNDLTEHRKLLCGHISFREHPSRKGRKECREQLSADFSFFFRASGFQGVVLFIHHHHFGDQSAGLFFIHLGVGNNDDHVPDGGAAGGSTVQTDDAAPPFAGNGIGFQAGTVVVIADLHSFARKNAGGIHEVFVDGNASHVFQICFGYSGAVDFAVHHGIGHYSASSTTLSMSLVLPNFTATAKSTFPVMVSSTSGRPGMPYIST